jgi:hypothetical protein
VIKNEAPALPRCAQLRADQDHDRCASGVHEFDNEAVALADSALSEHDSGDDGVAAGSFRSGPVSELASPDGLCLMVARSPGPKVRRSVGFAQVLHALMEGGPVRRP